jgi:hypothetical protein
MLKLPLDHEGSLLFGEDGLPCTGHRLWRMGGPRRLPTC